MWQYNILDHTSVIILYKQKSITNINKYKQLLISKMSERMIALHKAKMLEANNSGNNNNDINVNGTSTTAINNSSSTNSNGNDSANMNEVVMPGTIQRQTSSNSAVTVTTSNASTAVSQPTPRNGVARSKGKDLSNFANPPSSFAAKVAAASTRTPTATTTVATLTSEPMKPSPDGFASTNVPPTICQTDPQSSNPSTIMLDMDERLRHFLTLVKFRHKLCNIKNANISIGPTVPDALSKRTLNKQGVNYMDESVPAIMSAAADQFLATVLQQSMICRDRRLQGEEIAKKEKRALNKLKKRRKQELKQKQQKRLKLEQDLENALQKSNINGTGKMKKGPSSVSNKLIQDVERAIDEDEVNDRIDEEWDYYEKYTRNGDDSNDGDDQGIEDDVSDDDENDDDDEDENKFTLQLRDVVRPLEAWNVCCSGKIGLSIQTMDQDDEKKENETDEDDDSNSEGDGDMDIDDEDEDDEISMATEKTGGKKTGKRVPTPKAAKSPSKAKQRKKAATPDSGQSANPSVAMKAP